MYVEPQNKSCSFTYILSMSYMGIHFALTQLYALKSSLYLVIRKRRRNQLNKLPTIIENIYPGNRIFQIHSLPRMDRKRQLNLNRRNLILEICFQISAVVLGDIRKEGKTLLELAQGSCGSQIQGFLEMKPLSNCSSVLIWERLIIPA